MQTQLSLSLVPVTKAVYQPRGINILQLLFRKHFQNFADQHEAKHAIIYGRFRIERITEVVEKFIFCGDYRPKAASIFGGTACMPPAPRENGRTSPM